MANAPGEIIVNADADGQIVIYFGRDPAELLPLKDAEDLAEKLAVAIQ